MDRMRQMDDVEEGEREALNKLRRKVQAHGVTMLPPGFDPASG